MNILKLLPTSLLLGSIVGISLLSIIMYFTTGFMPINLIDAISSTVDQKFDLLTNALK